MCFDAKECRTDTFSLQNIHEHQYEFMKDFEEQGGISFIILYFTARDEKYYIPFKDIRKFVERAQSGGLKNFKYSEIDMTYRIKQKGGALVHYLEQLNMDLDSRG